MADQKEDELTVEASLPKDDNFSSRGENPISERDPKLTEELLLGKTSEGDSREKPRASEMRRENVGSGERAEDNKRRERKGRAACPPPKSKSRARSRDQRQCQKHFREMIGKHEMRNEDLEKKEAELRQRLETLECSMPAVMVWNIWRMAQGAPISSIHRVVEKQFKEPSFGMSLCPTTPSQHYDCRVREIESERKQALARTEEARKLWAEKEAALQEQKEKIEEAKRVQKDRTDRIAQLEEEVKHWRLALEKVKDDDTACSTGECGELQCRHKWLNGVSSVSSIRSTDLECLARLQDLAEAELSMKRQIADLERRECAYMRTLQQADDMWNKMEGDNASNLDSLQDQLDAKIAANQELADRICALEDEGEKLRKQLLSCQQELKQYKEKVSIERASGGDDGRAQIKYVDTAVSLGDFTRQDSVEDVGTAEEENDNSGDCEPCSESFICYDEADIENVLEEGFENALDQSRIKKKPPTDVVSEDKIKMTDIVDIKGDEGITGAHKQWVEEIVQKEVEVQAGVIGNDVSRDIEAEMKIVDNTLVEEDGIREPVVREGIKAPEDGQEQLAVEQRPESPVDGIKQPPANEGFEAAERIAQRVAPDEANAVEKGTETEHQVVSSKESETEKPGRDEKASAAQGIETGDSTEPDSNLSAAEAETQSKPSTLEQAVGGEGGQAVAEIDQEAALKHLAKEEERKFGVREAARAEAEYVDELLEAAYITRPTKDKASGVDIGETSVETEGVKAKAGQISIPREDLISWHDITFGIQEMISKCPDCSRREKDAAQMAARIRSYLGIDAPKIEASKERTSIAEVREVKVTSVMESSNESGPEIAPKTQHSSRSQIGSTEKQPFTGRHDVSAAEPTSESHVRTEEQLPFETQFGSISKQQLKSEVPSEQQKLPTKQPESTAKQASEFHKFSKEPLSSEVRTESLIQLPPESRDGPEERPSHRKQSLPTAEISSASETRIKSTAQTTPEYKTVSEEKSPSTKQLESTAKPESDFLDAPADQLPPTAQTESVQEPSSQSKDVSAEILPMRESELTAEPTSEFHVRPEEQLPLGAQIEDVQKSISKPQTESSAEPESELHIHFEKQLSVDARTENASEPSSELQASSEQKHPHEKGSEYVKKSSSEFHDRFEYDSPAEERALFESKSSSEHQLSSGKQPMREVQFDLEPQFIHDPFEKGEAGKNMENIIPIEGAEAVEADEVREVMKVVEKEAPLTVTAPETVPMTDPVTTPDIVTPPLKKGPCICKPKTCPLNESAIRTIPTSLADMQSQTAAEEGTQTLRIPKSHNKEATIAKSTGRKADEPKLTTIAEGTESDSKSLRASKDESTVTVDHVGLQTDILSQIKSKKEEKKEEGSAKDRKPCTCPGVCPKNVKRCDDYAIRRKGKLYPSTAAAILAPARTAAPCSEDNIGKKQVNKRVTDKREAERLVAGKKDVGRQNSGRNIVGGGKDEKNCGSSRIGFPCFVCGNPVTPYSSASRKSFATVRSNTPSSSILGKSIASTPSMLSDGSEHSFLCCACKIKTVRRDNNPPQIKLPVQTKVQRRSTKNKPDKSCNLEVCCACAPTEDSDLTRMAKCDDSSVLQHDKSRKQKPETKDQSCPVKISRDKLGLKERNKRVDSESSVQRDLKDGSPRMEDCQINTEKKDLSRIGKEETTGNEMKPPETEKGSVCVKKPDSTSSNENRVKENSKASASTSGRENIWNKIWDHFKLSSGELKKETTVELPESKKGCICIERSVSDANSEKIEEESKAAEISSHQTGCICSNKSKSQ